MKVSRSWRLALTLALVSSIVILAVNAAISTTRVITPIFPPGAQIQDIPQQAIITPTFNMVTFYDGSSHSVWIANVTGWKTLYIQITNQTACFGCDSILFSNLQAGRYIGGIGCIVVSSTYTMQNQNCVSDYAHTIMTSTEGEFIGIDANGNNNVIVTIFATNG